MFRRRPADSAAPGPAAGAPDPIVVTQTMPVRGRPEVLHRLALVPTRRAAWDPNFAESAWAEDEGGAALRNGARARFRLGRRLGGLRFEAQYYGVKAPRSGGWRSVRPVGPLESLSQEWAFRSVPGQPGMRQAVTEVTLTVRGQVRYAWVRPQVERLLQNMVVTTLLEMQRQVDAPVAGRIDAMNDEQRRRAEAERRAARGAGRRWGGASSRK